MSGGHICERGVAGEWSVGVYVEVIGRNCKANKSVKVNLFFSLHNQFIHSFSHTWSHHKEAVNGDKYTTVT